MVASAGPIPLLIISKQSCGPPFLALGPPKRAISAGNCDQLPSELSANIYLPLSNCIFFASELSLITVPLELLKYVELLLCVLKSTCPLFILAILLGLYPPLKTGPQK